ncbi:endonuclease/exonuclease/phosphatase family protein [Pedobacter psychrophilus]|nr:endonuclease/exonuclease/phosphatase family protein [Pedobacter psychrophilus]
MVKSDFWIFRSLEYSRFQNFIVSIIIIFLWVISYFYFHEIDYTALILNIICLIYLCIKIIPYTIFFKKEVKSIKSINPDREIKFVNANVLQHNTQYERLKVQLKQYNPDVILLLETDQKWKLQMEYLKKDYPFFIEVPKENTYGMLFYSKLKIKEEQIHYLVKDEIPSISCKLFLVDNYEIKLWGLHPEPPVPGENLYSTAKDKELAKVALDVKDNGLANIVMGDLNDVAWSDTTSLFTKTSGLLDVRKGRGFYSTFSAHHWFIKFPLDYIFCSPHFGFIKMKRLKFNGSDHYPIFTHLVYMPSLKTQQKREIDTENVKEAVEKANQEV